MTTTNEITVLSNNPIVTNGSWVNDEPYLAAKDVKEVLGWELKTEGLCRGDSCIPLGDNVDSNASDSYNLSQLANLIGRPSLAEKNLGIVAIGQSHTKRSDALTKRIAPDFTLPDISGADRALSDWAGKKRLLVAFSSW